VENTEAGTQVVISTVHKSKKNSFRSKQQIFQNKTGEKGIVVGGIIVQRRRKANTLAS